MLKLPKNPRPKREVPPNVAEAIQSVSARYKLRAEERAANVCKTAGQKAKALLDLWVQTAKTEYHDHPPISTTDREAGALVSYARRYEKASGLPFGEFMVWSIQNWRPLMRSTFFKVRTTPDYPTIPFFVGFHNGFEGAFGDRVEIERKARLTTRERDVEWLMQHKGKTRETAEREVDAKHGLTRLRDEIKSERLKLQQLQQEQVTRAEYKEREAMMDLAARRQKQQKADLARLLEKQTGPVSNVEGDFGKFGDE